MVYLKTVIEVLQFPMKPDGDVRKRLIEEGYTYDPSEKHWKRSTTTTFAFEEVLKAIDELIEFQHADKD